MNKGSKRLPPNAFEIRRQRPEVLRNMCYHRVEVFPINRIAGYVAVTSQSNVYCLSGTVSCGPPSSNEGDDAYAKLVEER